MNILSKQKLVWGFAFELYPGSWGRHSCNGKLGNKSWTGGVLSTFSVYINLFAICICNKSEDTLEVSQYDNQDEDSVKKQGVLISNELWRGHMNANRHEHF